MNWIIAMLSCICLICFSNMNVWGQVRSSHRKAQQHYENGTKYLQLNKYDEAVTELNRSVTLDPSFAPAFQQLGDIYRLQRKYKQAIPLYLRVMELNPSLTLLTQFGLGESLLLTGHYEQAIPYLEQYRQSKISEKGKRLVEKYLADCTYAIQHASYVDFTLTRLPGSINTRSDEYFPKLTADNAN
ncbi:MAG TPA: tetratricopeptide repeat protein, partial [Sphingobacterium sp.]|nr:tetratricopeptide repeat protein [Sphingobacterium sp.]